MTTTGTATSTTITVTSTTATRTGKNGRMARMKIRRAGAVTMALTVWDVWHRLPPRQRRWVFKQARKHGPRLAKQVIVIQRNRRKR